MNHTTITSPLALQKESVDPHKLIRSIAHEMTPMIHSHGLSLNLVIENEVNANVFTDPILFRQIVIDLLNYFVNKMSRGDIKVILDSNTCKPRNLLLMIEGENWFVPDEDLPNLFSEKNNHLFNAKQLVEQLGGTITAENEVGENTILFMILPVCHVLENEFLTTDFIIID